MCWTQVDIVHECNYVPLCYFKNILIYLAQFNLVFAWWCLTTFASKKSMHPFYKFCLLLPWKSLPPDLSISPWRCCTRQCICKQVGTLWRQTHYRTICSPPPFPTLLLPFHSLLQSRQGEMKVWKEMENKLFICIWEETRHLSKFSLHSLFTHIAVKFLRWGMNKPGRGEAPRNFCFFF